MPIHPTAIISDSAAIDSTADVGPYAIVEGHVRVGPGVRVYAHAYLTGWTEIGANCEIHPGAVVGHLPQDFAYDGSETYCRIGAGTIIREGASVHRGTAPESATIIGENCFIMATAHVGHNCQVGHGVKLANSSLLAGHVQVGDGAFLSGNTTVHQFVRVGELAMIAGQARVPMDIPPFFLTNESGHCASVNAVGMKRAGFSLEERDEIKQAYRCLYRSGKAYRESIHELASRVRTAPGKRLLDFLQASSHRGIAGGRDSSRSSS